MASEYSRFWFLFIASLITLSVMDTLLLRLRSKDLYRSLGKECDVDVPHNKVGGDELQNHKRKWTKTGQGYFLEVHGDTRKHAYMTVSMQIDRIRQFLDENANLETLEKERDCLDKLRDAFNEAQEGYNKVTDSDEDRQASHQCRSQGQARNKSNP